MNIQIIFVDGTIIDEWTVEVLEISPQFKRDIKKRQPSMPKTVAEYLTDGKVWPTIVTDLGKTDAQWVIKGLVKDPTWTSDSDIVTEILSIRTRMVKDSYLKHRIYLRFVGVKESDDTYAGISAGYGIPIKLTNAKPKFIAGENRLGLTLEMIEAIDFDL